MMKLTLTHKEAEDIIREHMKLDDSYDIAIDRGMRTNMSDHSLNMWRQKAEEEHDRLVEKGYVRLYFVQEGGYTFKGDLQPRHIHSEFIKKLAEHNIELDSSSIELNNEPDNLWYVGIYGKDIVNNDKYWVDLINGTAGELEKGE